jgi:NADH:ubiquinone oxidoreductase subunit 5 (subunit L)/multisubunit Na+/H+ antiporter MnhA subunit
MLAPMSILALICLALGLVPAPAVALAARTARAWDAGRLAPAVDAFHGPARIGLIAAGVSSSAALAAFWLWRRAAAHGRQRPGTWDCGFAAPSPRMQYGESSLSQSLVALFAWVIVPRRAPARVEGPFPATAQLRIEMPDIVLDRGVLPVVRGVVRAALRLKLFQKGQVQLYVLYILFALAVLLLVR